MGLREVLRGVRAKKVRDRSDTVAAAVAFAIRNALSRMLLTQHPQNGMQFAGSRTDFLGRHHKSWRERYASGRECSCSRSRARALGVCGSVNIGKVPAPTAPVLAPDLILSPVYDAGTSAYHRTKC